MREIRWRRDKEGKEVDGRILREVGGWILGALDFISAPGLLGVLGTGARISVDILELGSYLVGREELGFGQRFAEAVKEASGGQTEDY
jgi:hypothetical protein